MTSRYVDQLDLMLKLIEESGRIARTLFYGKAFEVFTKADGSKVTNIDFEVSKYVVAEAAAKSGIGVRSEEEGSTARYGENNAFDLDPIDSTGDLIRGRSRQPRRSNAAPSLGYWDKEPVAGAVIFPLLGVSSVTYLASKGGGAYRLHEGCKVRLQIDPTPTRRGIVFVTSKKDTPAAVKMSTALKQMGYTPVPEHGAVFKALGVVDRELLEMYPHHDAGISSLPVVGFVSQGVYLHDVAAAMRIARESGGVATSPECRSGKQPWAVANNKTVYQDLMRVALAR